MAARKSTRVNRKYKTKYRVTNWREYERGLRSRGDITVWFSDEAREAWTPPKNGRRGGQPRYSNLAIVTALTLRMVFHLPLRQTEGFLDSLLRLMELDQLVSVQVVNSSSSCIRCTLFADLSPGLRAE